MPFAHPLSIYPVPKAPRKVPTFRERKEVSSRACGAHPPCLGVRGTEANAVLATHASKWGGRSPALHNRCVQAPHVLAFTLDLGIVWGASSCWEPGKCCAGSLCI